MVEDLPRSYECDRPAPPAKQASRSTAPRSVTFPEDPPPLRSSKRPRTTSMVEHVNRFGSPTREGASSSIPPSHPTPPDPSGPPPSSARHTHTSLEVESDDPEPDRERAPSPATTIPGYIPSARPNAADSTHSASILLTLRLQTIEIARGHRLMIEHSFASRWTQNLVHHGKP